MAVSKKYKYYSVAGITVEWFDGLDAKTLTQSLKQIMAFERGVAIPVFMVLRAAVG